MKLDADFTQDEFEILAKIALRFMRRVSASRLETDNIELLLAASEFHDAQSAMRKIQEQGDKDGVYWRAANPVV